MKNNRTLSPKEKYDLYEAAVQDPEGQSELFHRIYEELVGKEPKDLCEDFCGTFLISIEWLMKSANRTATAIDISTEPLRHGKKYHLKKLSTEQKRRLSVIQGDVLDKTQKKFDVIAACNFSFFVFHERKTLLDYCKRSYRSLKKDGVFILEMAGGQGFIDAPYEEEKEVVYEEGPKEGKHWFDYTWKHKSFEPLTRNGLYSISFKLKGKPKYKDAFLYDWRVYTIPEVRDCLLEAGFRDVAIYWEMAGKKGQDSTFERVFKTDQDDYTWICYAVGLR